jgi:2-hydroxy-6-oxonona-2,4-dienedioate hydrolase
VLTCLVTFLIALPAPAEAALPFPESCFDTIEGIRVHYRLWAVPLAELKGNVAFLHGFAASTFSWRKNIDTLLREGYRVVAVDIPPFGYSDRKLGMDQSPDNRAKLLWRLFDNIDMKSGIPCRPMSWTLVGNSMGGGVAVAMAIDRPERTARMILVDPAVDRSASRTQPSLLKCGLIRGLAVSWTRHLLSDRRSFADVLSSAYGRRADSAAVDGYLIPMRLPGTIDAILDGAVHAGAFEPADLEQVHAPTLIIWGDNDRVIPPAEAGYLTHGIPDSELKIIHRGGHTPMETEPAIFNRLMLDFLSRSAR